jgi:hypothetical protein
VSPRPPGRRTDRRTDRLRYSPAPPCNPQWRTRPPTTPGAALGTGERDTQPRRGRFAQRDRQGPGNSHKSCCSPLRPLAGGEATGSASGRHKRPRYGGSSSGTRQAGVDGVRPRAADRRSREIPGRQQETPGRARGFRGADDGVRTRDPHLGNGRVRLPGRRRATCQDICRRDRTSLDRRQA